MKKISILIPCYNEEASLPLLYPQLVKLMDEHADYQWELMFVNDGSTDGTLQLLREMREKASGSTGWTCRATSARERHAGGV